MTVPNIFHAGKIISSSEVNENFSTLDTSVSTLQSTVATLTSEVGASLVQAPWLGVKDDASTDSTALVNNYLASHKRLHFPILTAGRYAISSSINIVLSGSHVSFDRGARLVGFNGANPGGGIRVNGTAPTSYINLSADASEGQNQIVLAADPGWAVGDWVELRSEGVITGCPNSQANKIGCLRKITARSGTGPVTFTLNKALPYTFLVSDTAKAGKAGVVENVVIDCAQINDENFGSNIISFPIYLNYAAYVTLLQPRAFGSKLPYGPDNATGDFIKMNRCFDVEIHNPFMRHGAYYGLSIPGMNEDIRSYGGSMEDVRHAVSVVFLDTTNPEKYGQPLNVLVDGMTARYTTLSSFDTHDTGRDIRFTNCVAHAAGDDGFQARTTNVTFNQCVARYCFNDGFSQDSGASGLYAVDCVSEYNGRFGVNWNYALGSWLGGSVSNNGSSRARGGLKSGGGPGFNTYGGVIQGATITDNGGTSAIIHGTAGFGQGPLLITGCNIPASATQISLLAAPVGYDLGLAKLNDNEIVGYGDNMFQNFGTVTNVSPTTRGNRVSSVASQRSGTFTLSGGAVTINNPAVRRKAAAAFGEAINCSITLTPTGGTGIPGALYIAQIVDKTSFTIKSTNFVQPTRTNVIRNNTNVGAVNGDIGAGGALPTNWTLSAVSGLTTSVIGTGTEEGPGGGTQNYIDIRISGTAGAAGGHIIAFDAANNPAAAASPGQTWTGAFGAKLVGGALTGLSPYISVTSYTSGVVVVDNFNAAVAIGSTPTRPALTGTLGSGAAFTRAGVNFVTVNGAVIDATVRIYMPQLELGPDASAPIATSGSAVTRTANTLNADNSTGTWSMAL